MDSPATTAALDAIRATCADYDAAMRETHRELGKRKMQVTLLREALARHGMHQPICLFPRALDAPFQCHCGLDAALTIGADLATGADVVRGASLAPTEPPERP